VLVRCRERSRRLTPTSLQEFLPADNRRCLARPAARDDFPTGVRALDWAIIPCTVEDETANRINFPEAGDDPPRYAFPN
jgi:hypothetical protein